MGMERRCNAHSLQQALAPLRFIHVGFRPANDLQFVVATLPDGFPNVPREDDAAFTRHARSPNFVAVDQEARSPEHIVVDAWGECQDVWAVSVGILRGFDGVMALRDWAFVVDVLVERALEADSAAVSYGNDLARRVQQVALFLSPDPHNEAGVGSALPLFLLGLAVRLDGNGLGCLNFVRVNAVQQIHGGLGILRSCLGE